MIARPKGAPHLLASAAIFIVLALAGSARGSPKAPAASDPGTPTEHDGQHDFYFEIGIWKTHVSRLQHPLTGSNTWTQYDGTTVVRKVWDGRANLLELKECCARGSACATVVVPQAARGFHGKCSNQRKGRRSIHRRRQDAANGGEQARGGWLLHERGLTGRDRLFLPKRLVPQPRRRADCQ
jgi:hypothetical protein